MPTDNTVGEIGVSDIYGENALFSRYNDGYGPCSQRDALDPLELRVLLPVAYATLAFNWNLENATPATTATLGAVTRVIGKVGIADSGSDVQSTLGHNWTLDRFHTSFAKDGFFLSNYDFLVNSIGFQPVGPITYQSVTSAPPGGADGYVTNAWGAAIPGVDSLAQRMFAATMASFSVSFSLDNETKCDWLGAPMDIAGAGFGLDGGAAGSNGLAVRDNVMRMRLNIRARSGASTGRDTTKRFLTTLTRTAASAAPVLTNLGSLGLVGGANTLALTQLIRVVFYGCPVLPLAGAAIANQSIDISQMANEIQALKAQLGQAANVAPSAGLYSRRY